MTTREAAEEISISTKSRTCGPTAAARAESRGQKAIGGARAHVHVVWAGGECAHHLDSDKAEDERDGMAQVMELLDAP